MQGTPRLMRKPETLLRPAVRPEWQLSPEEIKAALLTHFIHNKAPRCYRDGSGCVYRDLRTKDGTARGCAVGCLLTQDDAEALDKMGFEALVPESLNPKAEAYELLSHYFDLQDPATFILLRSAQLAHDNAADSFPRELETVLRHTYTGHLPRKPIDPVQAPAEA